MKEKRHEAAADRGHLIAKSARAASARHGETRRGVLDHYLGGAYFPRGGSRAIRDGFVKAIERKGGVMLRNHAVLRVVVSGDRVSGVRCANGMAVASARG